MTKHLETKGRYWLWIGLFFFAFFIITLVSKSSPLYYINDGSETNTLYTMAKGWKSGQIPYKDLFDYRGPMIYLVYLLASFIGPETGYVGLYVVEILALFLTLCLFYKFSTAYFSSYKSLWTTFFFAVLLVMSPYYGKGGNVEELMMPFLFLPILLMQKFSGKVKETIESYFKLGLLSGGAMGIIFWSKYSLLGGWLGFILCFIVMTLFYKQFQRLFSFLGGTLLSFGALSVLFMGYFIWKDAVEVLKNNYFLCNYQVYGANEGGWIRSILQSITAISQNNLFYLFLIVGLFIVLNSKQIFNSISSKLFYFISFLFLWIGLSFGENNYSQSYLALFSYSGVLLVCLCTKYFSVPKKNGEGLVKTGMIAVLSILILFGINQNLSESKLYPENRTVFIAQNEQQSSEILPMQKEFGEIIKKEKNPTLLMYGLADVGVYKQAGIVPHIKYFMMPSISFSEKEELIAEQNKYINEKEVMFVVLQRKGTTINLKTLPKNITNNYELVAQKSQYDRREMTYFLFKVKKE